MTQTGNQSRIQFGFTIYNDCPILCDYYNFTLLRVIIAGSVFNLLHITTS